MLRSAITTAVASALLAIGLTTLAAAPASATPTDTPTASPVPSASVSASPTPTPTATPTPTPLPPLPQATRLSHYGGHSAGSRTLTLTGTGFAQLSAVLVGGVEAPGLVVVNDTTARFVMGIAPNYQAAVLAVSLRSLDGRIAPTPIRYAYKAVNRLDKQMQYAFAHWNLYSSKRFGYITDNDCANFTSQTLLARGWRQSSAWWNDGSAAKGLPDASSTWISSTAMSNWLKTRPDLATHLTYTQRDQATVGDIVQFNWNSKKNPGVWLHTAVVSRIVVLPNGRHDIHYVAHTNNTSDGGGTQYLADHYSKYLRIQFWHLKQ